MAALAAALIIAVAQATPPEQNPPGYFELDKNLINNEQTPSFGASNKTLGSLGGNINATQTSFTVCQNDSSNPTTSIANPITIQVEAERMTVGTITNATGGGCSGQFKRTYSDVTRGPVNEGGDAASHGASGVQGYVTQVTFNNTVGDDWDQVFDAVDANGPPSETDPNPCSGPNWTGNADAVACDFVADPPGETVFTGGGSKDDLDINEGTAPNFTKNNWKYTNQSVPDADDITDGYAIKYVDPTDDHQFLYFGADRTAVNGAKDMGFWFFRNPVATNPDNDTFIGQHAIGDILLLGTFTQGGAATTIRVFEWVGTGGDTNNVLDSASGDFGDCVPGGQDDGCNTVNNGTIPSDGWAYQSKISNTPANTIFAGGAMEGGIDLTSLGLEGCFSTFMAETRSAPEIGAQLKDFLLGEFEACQASLTTTPADAGGTALTDHSDPPNDVPDVTIGTGAAGVDVTDQADLTVNGTPTWSGTLHFFLCGPIASGTCDSGGVEIGSGAAVDQDTDMPVISGTAHLTEVGRYCWRGFFDSDTEGVDDVTDASEGECFEVLPVTPTLTTTAVEPGVGLSPTIVGGLADLNGDGVVDGSDDSSAFYGDTSIIDGALDCDAWASDNDGAAGDGVIDDDDDCTLIGVPNVTIQVEDGEFQTADGPLPKVFNAAQPTNADISDSDFAWSTIYGKVDSNGDEVIDGEDCSFNVIGDADILGNDPTCGSGQSNPNFTNGKVDLNGDGTITSADSCTGCFLGHDVANGLIVNGTLPFGEPVYDIAALTGTANQPGTNGPNPTYPSINATDQNLFPANGTIEFTLLKDDCSTAATGTGATNPQTKTVSGDNDYVTDAFTPDAPGDYHWVAEYSGDSPNTSGPVTHNDGCTEAGEDVTVQQVTPLLSTKQFVYPQDKAKITCSPVSDCSSSGTGNLSGNVRFRLFNTLANCTDHGDETTVGTNGLMYISGLIPVSGPAPQTVGHPAQTSAAVTAGTTVYWRVTYTSSVGAQTDASPSACSEQTTVSFAGDDSSITVP